MGGREVQVRSWTAGSDFPHRHPGDVRHRGNRQSGSMCELAVHILGRQARQAQ